MKRNAILGVFCQKRNVTFFFVFLSELRTGRNFIKNSGTPLLGFGALPAGSETIPAGSEALPAGSEALPVGSEANAVVLV